MFRVPVVSLLVSLVVAATPASAQIYTWRDASGVLVLSNKPEGEKSDARRAVVASPDTKTGGAPMTIASSLTRRAALYEGIIREQSELNDVRADLVRAMIQVESAFDPAAVSPKGAMGLMQLMPATAATFGVGNPFNPNENIRAGVAYLRQLLDRYGDDEALALAAYNAGPGAVDRHGQAVPPYQETQQYVSKINQMAPQTTRVPGATIYKTVEIVDGREVIRYSDRP